MQSIPPHSAWDGGGGAEGTEQPLTPLLAQPLTEGLQLPGGDTWRATGMSWGGCSCKTVWEMLLSGHGLGAALPEQP